MSIILPILIVLHVVPGVFWAGSTFVLARLGAGGANLGLRAPQMGAGAVTVLAGIALMALNHRGPPSLMEYVLGLGALLALIAMGIQQGLAWRALKATPPNPARYALGQRIAAGLLVLTVICMVTWRYA
jgi:hypothetical protein